MNNTSLHWTEDPALLEQFVLGQMSADRVKALNEHLKTCPQCVQAVEQEREFIKSLRAYGRDQLKSRLKEKLERTPSRAVPWPHIMSAAAIVIFVVGLGIYNNWWREPELIQSEDQLGGEKETRALQSPVTPEKGAGGEVDRLKTQPRLERELRAGKATVGEPKSEVRLDDLAKDEKAVQGLGAERPAQAAGAGEVDVTAAIQGEHWVEGTMVDLVPKEKSGPPSAREDVPAPASRMAQAQKNLFATQQARYLLQQMPAATLPPQQKQVRKSAEVIPTRVEPTNDGILLTAYTDQFVLPDKKILGQFYGPDSLVFIVDGLRIAYKPSAFPVK